MSLDVTFGTSGTGSAPPSPSSHAGVVGAKATASDLPTLFAALLANGTQASSTPPGKAAKPVVSPSTEEPSRRTDLPDDDPNDAPNPPAAPDAALTTLLMALTAPPNTLQTIPDKPPTPVSPNATRVGKAPETTKQTTQEAMDTVPVLGTPAPGVKADTADGGLLPLSLNQSAAPSMALPVATPPSPAPAASVNVVPPTASTLSAPMPLETSAPTQAVVDSVPPVAPTPVAQWSVSGFEGVPNPAARSSAFATTTPAIPIQMNPQTVTAPGVPVLDPSAVTVAASLPPTALSLNDIRPDALNSPGPVSVAAPGRETALPRLLSPVTQNTLAPVTSQAAPSSNAAVPTPTQAAVLVQTVLQNEPQPANNTGMPTPKANETTVKTTEAVPAEGQAPEFVVPLTTKLQGQFVQTKQIADTSGQTLPPLTKLPTRTSQRDTDAEKPSEQAAVADTVLMENAAALTTSAPTTTAPQSATATTLTPTDRAAVMQQISDGAQQIAQRPAPNGVREINLQLHPHDWGQIKLSVRMTPTIGEDGAAGTAVIAHIVADNPAVKAALETHTAELRQTLQNAGMKLDQLSVTVQAPDAGAQSGTAGQEQQPFSQDGGAWTGQGIATPQNDASSTGQSGSGFGSAFSSNFGDGRGGQTNHQPSQPASVWADDTETLETTPLANISTRLPMGRWDSRA